MKNTFILNLAEGTTEHIRPTPASHTGAYILTIEHERLDLNPKSFYLCVVSNDAYICVE